MLLSTRTRQEVNTLATHATQEEQAIIGFYEIEVLKAKEIHGIMTRDPWLHYMSARLHYLTAKKEADEQYLKRREELYETLICSVRPQIVERATQNVERNGVSAGKP
jgi:hypothetical protein